MMPGLLPTRLSLSAASSTSRATDRGAFPKPYNERIHADEASAGPSSNLPHGSIAAVRVFHTPVSQAMRVVAAKVGVSADRRRINTGRMSECSSSGSDHEPSSVILVAMVNDFMESESVSSIVRADSCDFLEKAMSNGLAEISKSIQSLAHCRDDQEINLLRDVQAIVESEDHQSECLRTDETKSLSPYGCRKLMVMSALQKIGYDAAICKTRWDHSGGLPGGDYEYIDILFASDAPTEPSRLLVDIEFQSQFEIARPSSEFSAALQLVPPIFVGRPERLQQIVHLMAEATKQSLCIKGLHIPPWRKLNYMKAKWFSSYKRTSNNVARCKLSGDFVVVSGYGLDSSCANELELLCHGSTHMTGGSKHVISCSNARDDFITVTTTDWQPPPLEVRPRSNIGSQSKVKGLGSILLHAGLPTCNEVIAKAA